MNRFNANKLSELEKNKNSHTTGIISEPSDSIKFGSQFNLIMKQIGLGLPVEPFLIQYPQIAEWVKLANPFLQLPGTKQWDAELQCFYKKQLLEANYDLIIYQNNQVIGIDWTIQKSSNFRYLENSLLTQLRLFLLCIITKLPYEQVNLVYVFVNKPDIYQFAYSQNQHLAFKERLESILAQFTEEEVQEYIQHEDEQVNLEMLHQKWLKGEITVKDYFDAIPEVEL